MCCRIGTEFSLRMMSMGKGMGVKAEILKAETLK